ncbi:MAG: hypothetical protein AB2598_06110 [Candidatus Thiodiazotropha sp.]
MATRAARIPKLPSGLTGRKTAEAVAQRHKNLDAPINSAGAFMLSDPNTPDGLDARFAVNTIPPYLPTQRFLPTCLAHPDESSLSPLQPSHRSIQRY